MKFFNDDSIRKTIITYTLSGIFILSFYLCVTRFHIVSGYISSIVSIIKPFIIGFVISFLLKTPMEIIEYKLFKKWNVKASVKHGVAVLLAVLFGAFCIFVLFSIMIPSLYDSIFTLVQNLDEYTSNIDQYLLFLEENFNLDTSILMNKLHEFIPNTNTIIKQLGEFVTTYLPSVISTAMSIGNGVIQFVVGIIVGIYLLLDGENFRIEFNKALFAFCKESVANRILYTIRLTDRTFKDFISGKILDSIIIGIICFIMMSIFKWPYPLLISVIIGVTNVIPFFGPFIGAVPGFFIVLVVSPKTSILFLIFILLLQQFDGNVLGPKILGNSIGLPAFWIIFAILIGQGLFGIVGMIIGVPLFSVLYFLFKERVDNNLKMKGKYVE